MCDFWLFSTYRIKGRPGNSEAAQKITKDSAVFATSQNIHANRALRTAPVVCKVSKKQGAAGTHAQEEQHLSCKRSWNLQQLEAAGWQALHACCRDATRKGVSPH